MAKKDSPIPVGPPALLRSHDELNPLLIYNDDGTLDPMNSMDNVRVMTTFLNDFYCLDNPFEEATFHRPLYLITRMLDIAIGEVIDATKTPAEASHG